MNTGTFNYAKLRGRIREKFTTEANFALAMGMAKTTMSAKLNQTNDFSQSEIAKAIKLLDLDVNEVTDYFFSRAV